MISAIFYLQWHSLPNRLKLQVKRLKQPKYLIGAIVGGLYFFWYFFRVLLWPRSKLAAGTSLPGFSMEPLFFESLGALVLLVIVFLAWMIPHERGSLAFTEAEVAFLFPAPVSRKWLIQYKLLRSQLPILVTVAFFTLLSSRLGSSGHTLIRAAGWWIILFTLNLHFMGSSFAVTMLLDRGISNWKRRVTVLGFTLALIGFVGLWTARDFPNLASVDLTHLDSITDYVRKVLVSGPLPFLLYPFRLVVRPFLAPDGLAFLLALGPALLLMAMHYLWVMRADVAFEEASVEASKRIAERIASVRAGKWGTTGKNLKRKRPPFKLGAAGPPLMALLWKNLIDAGSVFTARIWIVLALMILVVLLALRGNSSAENWPMVVGSIAGMFCLWAILLGPHILRQDFRRDLAQADLLKLYPLPGWQIALGELLAPALILTGVEWLLLILTAGLLPRIPGQVLSGSQIASLALGAAILLPMFNVISLLIPNAAVLWFPSWFQTGKESPQGIEATGQRLIFAVGQLLVFLVALIPAALVFLGVLLVLKFMTGLAVAMLAASLAAALVLALEAGLGVIGLGKLFERLDLSAEQMG